MFTDDTEPTEGLNTFFSQIWREQEGYVYLPTHNPNNGEWHKAMYQWPAHRDYVVKHVLRSSASGLNVFFAPAIFSEASPHREKVLGSHVVWTDFDGNAPEMWPSEGQEGTLDGPEALPPPTMRVQSSKEHNEHVYWLLDSFETDVTKIEGINRSISYTYRADTSGWDANQILRPPFTTNYKEDYKNEGYLPVTVAHYSETRHPVEKFKSLKPILQLVSDSIDTENLPVLDTIIAKYPWDEEHFKMFMDPQIPQGHRSSALMRLGYFGAEVGMSDAEIYAVLENADSRWGKFKDRSDKKKRLLDIVNRAKMKHPTPTTDLTFAGLKGESKVDVDRRYVYGLQDFLDEDIEVEWVLQHLLEAGGFGMFASAPGVGKTQLSLQLAASLALGLDFIGYQSMKSVKLVLFSLEMGPVSLRHLLETVIESYTTEQRAVLQENLLVVPLGESLPVRRPDSLQFVKSILDEHQPQGVIFDSLIKLAGGKLDVENAVAINEFYSSIRSRYGAFCIVVHHNRKASGDNKKPTDLSDIYGEVYITSDLTFVLVLWRDSKWPREYVEISTVKSRLHPERYPIPYKKSPQLFFMEYTPDHVGAGLMGDGKERETIEHEPVEQPGD